MHSAGQRIVTIHQIVPAHPGWSMETQLSLRGRGFGPDPVVVWALVEGHDGRRFAVGMGPDMTPLEHGEVDSVVPDLLPPDESFRRYIWGDE